MSIRHVEVVLLLRPCDDRIQYLWLLNSTDAKRNISSLKLYSLVLALNTSLGSLQQSRGPHREFVQGKQYSQELSSNERCGRPSIVPDLPATLIKSPRWTTTVWRWTIRLYISMTPSSMPIVLDCHNANWHAQKESDTLSINSINLETKARAQSSTIVLRF